MKAFIALLVVAIAVGGGVGGAVIFFAAQEDAAPEQAQATDFPTPTLSRASASIAPSSAEPIQAAAPEPSQADGAGTAPSQEELASLRQRARSGELSQEEVAQLRQRFQQGGAGGGGGGPGGGFGRFGQGGGGSLAGAIEGMDSGILTLATEQGSQQARLGLETVVRITRTGGLDDLEAGMTVSVQGQRDGSRFVAETVAVIPEGTDGGPGAGAGGRGGGGSGQAGGGGRFGPGGGGGGGGPGGGGGGFGQRGGGGGPGQGGGGGAPSPRLFGTVDSIGTDSLTINAQQGPLQVTVEAQTSFVFTSLGGPEDLTEGMQVTVLGPQGEDGVVDARAILVTLETTDGGGSSSSGTSP